MHISSALLANSLHIICRPHPASQLSACFSLRQPHASSRLNDLRHSLRHVVTQAVASQHAAPHTIFPAPSLPRHVVSSPATGGRLRSPGARFSTSSPCALAAAGTGEATAAAGGGRRKLVFLGTPEVAAGVLQQLLEAAAAPESDFEERFMRNLLAPSSSTAFRVLAFVGMWFPC